MKKLLVGVIEISPLFGVCVGLEKITNSDRTTPMTESLVDETSKSFSRFFGMMFQGMIHMAILKILDGGTSEK